MDKSLTKLINALNSDNKYIAMLAPSFVVDYKYPDIVLQLRKLGFDKVVELTFGAKMVNKNYHDIICDYVACQNSKSNLKYKQNIQKQTKKANSFFIASVCPSINMAIENQFPLLKDKLIKVTSPMTAMQRICKKLYPNHKPVFIGPCFTKKDEAKKAKISFAITFKELNELFKYYDENKLWIKVNKSKKSLNFDAFYNDYTKVYPLSGALSQTMHYKEILRENQVIVTDGPNECLKLFSELSKSKNKYEDVVFFDVLFCKGGCVGGPGINSCEDLSKKTKKVLAYLKQSKQNKLGRHKGTIPTVDNLNFRL